MSQGPIWRGCRRLWRAAMVATILSIATIARAEQAVTVPSLDVSQGRPVSLPGHWFRVDGGAPAPAWLLLHGCGGPYGRDGRLSQRLRDEAAWLNGLGHHVLVLDSLTPRGERELCTQRVGTRRVTQRERRRDALGALRWLAAQPGVDSARLAMLGWSNGGSTVLAATNLRQPEVTGAGIQPRLAVAFYPGCEADARRGYRPGAPLLMLLGGADDWTPAAPCLRLAAAAADPKPEVEVYDGAYHGFDGTGPVRRRDDVPNGARPGHGVHVGGDAAARTASRARLERFVRLHLGAT